MSEPQELSNRTQGDRTAPPTEPEYQLQCATARLEAALQSLDLETETEQAEAIITALRATDRACELGETKQPDIEITDRLQRK
ncbi:hypothetical protein [Halovenus sp. HT40]|uniref:hypothetical protein n=1 Tax=Halovenus sp. HT40 TaxID=3126691 RepID=UPI00300F2A8A